MSVMSIKFTDMTELLRKERIRSIKKCERSVITMILLQLNYLIHGLGNCADDTLPVSLASETKTGLNGSVIDIVTKTIN